MIETPTLDAIRRRCRVAVDGRPGGRVRAIRPDGRRAQTSGRRYFVLADALRWRALGYEQVEVSFATPRRPRPDFRPFPGTREEAVEAVRELAAGRVPGSAQWRRLLARIERGGAS